jgi:hypothetical protein
VSDTPETDAFFFRTDIDWDMEVDFARCLERERDELKKQLIDAKSSTAFWMGKYNNAMQLRGEDPLCDSFWKTLDKLSAERALADRLAEALTNPATYTALEALDAWKEARND